MRRRAARGILAGVAGALTMHALRLLWESATKHQPEDAMFGFDREADINAARLVSGVVSGRSISDQEAEKLGLALHYVYGAGIGLLYSSAPPFFPAVRRAQGTLFGAFLWLLADEIPITLSGVSNPFHKTAVSHVSVLVAHLLFGATVEHSMRAMKS